MRNRNSNFKTYRLIGLLLLVALLGLVGVGSAQTISDVPPSHWAYEAVKDLIDRGYLALDDGRFQGTEPVDRYFFVSTVARILREIESGAVAPQSQADVELLRRIVNEYREDLVKAMARVEEAESKLARTDKELAATDETISVALDRLGQLQVRGDELERRHSQLASELQDEVASLRALINSLSVDVREETASDQAAMRQEVSNLLAELRQENARVLDQMKGSLETETNQLQDELNELRRVADLALAEIQSQLNAHAEALAAQQMALENQGRTFDEQDQQLLAAIQTMDSAMRQIRSELTTLAELTSRMDNLQSRLDNVERQTLAMQSQIGLSEEQLAALSQRLMNELDSRYQHSFLLSGNVSNELRVLRDEFNSYRDKTEQDLGRARQAQTLGIIGALLGLISFLN